MKAIISLRDDRAGFLRCECDTKYAADTFDRLIEHGCRVCGKAFVRVDEKRVTELLMQTLKSLGWTPKMISDYINKEVHNVRRR